MKFTKKLIKSLAVVAIIGSISASAYASSTIEGGWIEGRVIFLIIILIKSFPYVLRKVFQITKVIRKLSQEIQI